MMDIDELAFVGRITPFALWSVRRLRPLSSPATRPVFRDFGRWPCSREFATSEGPESRAKPGGAFQLSTKDLLLRVVLTKVASNQISDIAYRVMATLVFNERETFEVTKLLRAGYGSATTVFQIGRSPGPEIRTRTRPYSR
jgi:hypothetical protein